MKIILSLILLSNIIFSQSEYLQDISNSEMPVFYQDSLRFNFTEAINSKATISSYGTKTQLGVLGSFKTDSFDSIFQKAMNIPSFYYVYNNFEGEFILLGNQHIREGVYHDNGNQISAYVDKGFLYFTKGTDFSKFSFNLESEYGNYYATKNNNTEKKLYSLNLDIGTTIKPTWNSEFLLDFDFNILKDDLRKNKQAITGDTKYSNYMPDITTGILMHSKQHRELGHFSWKTSKQNIISFDTINNNTENLIENQNIYSFGVFGNFLINKIPLSFSYNFNYLQETKDLWKTLNFENQVGGTIFKEIPISCGIKYSFSSMDIILDVTFNKINFDIKTDSLLITYLNNLSPINDHEFSIATYIKYLKIENSKKTIKTDFIFGLGGGYTLLRPYDDNFMEFVTYEDLENNKNKEYGSKPITSEEILPNKRARSFITTGFKTKFYDKFIIDIKYDLNLYRDSYLTSKAFSDQFFASNNLLLKFYYLF